MDKYYCITQQDVNKNEKYQKTAINILKTLKNNTDANYRDNVYLCVTSPECQPITGQEPRGYGAAVWGGAAWGGAWGGACVRPPPGFGAPLHAPHAHHAQHAAHAHAHGPAPAPPPARVYDPFRSLAQLWAPGADAAREWPLADRDRDRDRDRAPRED
ncbi:hypothetical protein ACJJTC_000067 [Scirpophaga incertulas]